MKLCRFELTEEPGPARTGIVHGDKVYETDGTNPIGVYGFQDVRLLSPIGPPPSTRFFPFQPELKTWDTGMIAEFHYINPVALHGSGEAFPLPTEHSSWDACLAIVVGGSGSDFSPDQADEAILGLCPGIVCRRDNARFPAHAFDVAFFVGPVLTTPEELDDAVEAGVRGRRYNLAFGAARNGEVITEFNLNDIPYTPAELLASASTTMPLRVGDLILMSLGASLKPAEPGDRLELKGTTLGLLAARPI